MTDRTSFLVYLSVLSDKARLRFMFRIQIVDASASLQLTSSDLMASILMNMYVCRTFAMLYGWMGVIEASYVIRGVCVRAS